MAVRVRFAPSPTGSLHLGGLRTALFNALFARANRGSLILRIEDTDQSRLVPGSISLLQSALAWAGIHFSEGPCVGGSHGPYVQSQRLELYAAMAQRLLSAGLAYRCYCSKSMLTLARTASLPRHCECRSRSPAASLSQSMTSAVPYTVRLKAPASPVALEWNDAVGGRLGSDAVVDDAVLVKSDGWPTYHFASVVDDHHMQISHVLRGQEWIPSTPIHLLLYHCLKWEPPVFAHLPLLLNPDGSKLSKRAPLPPKDGPSLPVTVDACKRAGYLPEAIVHFVSRLGWTPPPPVENHLCNSLDELASHFTLEKIHRSPAIVSVDRLIHLNRSYIDLLSLSPEHMAALVRDLRNALPAQASYEDAYLAKIIAHARGRVSKINEIPTLFAYFFANSPQLEETFRLPRIQWLCRHVHALLSSLPESDFSSASIEQRLREWMLRENQIGAKREIYTHLRLVITRAKIGASLVEAMEILGKNRVLAELDQHCGP